MYGKQTAIAVYALGVACFGAIGLFRTWSGLDAYGASFVRGVWGAITLSFGAFLFRPNIFKVSATYLLRCVLWGSLLGSAILIYFLTMDYSNQSVGALFLFLQIIWYPFYTKWLFPDESGKTRWLVYITSNLFTVLGTFIALGFFRSDLHQSLNLNAIFYGAILSFIAFTYFVVGRWLFFAGNKREMALIKEILMWTAPPGLDKIC